MNSLVRDMMTTDVVTVEADEGGRLLGIVSRADLLKVFARPDDAIQREVVDEVILRDLMMDPSRFFVRVEDRLTYDVDDRGRDVLMTPWLRP
jgi:CBS domain-containing protein